jgi:hypothetical protein
MRDYVAKYKHELYSLATHAQTNELYWWGYLVVIVPYKDMRYMFNFPEKREYSENINHTSKYMNFSMDRRIFLRNFACSW